jgi:uncharacterized repeat protein (TIGR02543 family)
MMIRLICKVAATLRLGYAHVFRAQLHAIAVVLLVCLGGYGAPALAQPAGWSQITPISVVNGATTAETGYQLRMVIDTSGMAANATDLRFGADSAGATLLDYWIESGAGTANTVVWVKLPTLAASSALTIYMFSGNPSAPSASTVNVFDYMNLDVNSATNRVAGGQSGALANSQRGFRFSPNEDVLMTQLGKREPNGTTRYVSLFNFVTQAILAQQQVSGPAAQYSYVNVAQPIWLTAGTQYVLTLHQGATDGYYFASSSQINPKLTYGDMRFCNDCTQNSFPTNVLANFHFGYADFQFRTKKNLTPTPTYQLNAFAVGGAVSGLAGSGLVLSLNGGAQTRNITANGIYVFSVALPIGDAYAVAVQTQPSDPPQMCVVANGSGTIASSSITDVSVTCTTNSYPINAASSPALGGTVSCVPNPVVHGGESNCAVSPVGAYVFTGWTGDCGGNASCALNNVTAARNVTAQFAPTLNVDGSAAATRYRASTDAALIIRYMRRLRNAALTSHVLADDATQTDPFAIATYLLSISALIDVDGNGSIDAETDGLLIARYMLGFRGDSLIADALGPEPRARSSFQDIEAWLAALMP